MRRSIFTLLLLLCFVVTSCQDDRVEAMESAYDAEDWKETVRIADDILSEELSDDALFFKAMSLYESGDTDGAFDASMLYGLLYDDDDSHYYDMMRLILHTSRSDEITIRAGGKLYKTDRMSKQDYISYYTALARQKDEKLAEEVYVKVTPLMRPGEIALMNVLAEAPCTRILSSLENLYQTEGISRDFMEVAMLSIPLFINRGEGELLYELVKKGYGSNYSYALYIGDLMFSLGRIDEAAIYWNAAREEFPAEAGERLHEIGYDF